MQSDLMLALMQVMPVCAMLQQVKGLASAARNSVNQIPALSPCKYIKLCLGRIYFGS